MSEPVKTKRGRPTKNVSIRKKYDENEIQPKQRSGPGKVHAKQGEMSKLISQANDLRMMGKWKIDRNNPEEMEERVEQYITYCIDHDMKPTVESMALAFGVDRTTLWKWKEGVSALPEACRRVIENGYNLMNDILAQCFVDGRINPVAAIFLLKNNHDYKDQSETVVTVNNPYAEQSTEDVKGKYLDGIVDTVHGEGIVE